jgi:hypothetical protein
LSGKDICFEDVNVSDPRESESGTTYHEVTLGKGELVGQTLLCGVGGGTLDLVVVVVETDDVDASELDNLTRRAADTTANIQHAHVVGEVHLVGQVVLVAGNGLVEGLAVRIAGKVEGLAPAVLVQVGGQVVIVPGEGGIFISSFLCKSVSVTAIWAAPVAYLSCLLGLVGGGLVVPVLEVLVHSSLLRSLVLLQHGSHATSRLCGGTVHGLVEGGITAVIFLFERSGRHYRGR